jgi:hypothetical protein
MNRFATTGQGFIAKVNYGHFFELLPTTSCPNICDVPPIIGPSSVNLHGEITLSDIFPGGVWTSADPSIASIDPGSGLLTGNSYDYVEITYTVAGCSTSVWIHVYDPGPKNNDSTKHIKNSVGTTRLQIDPNPTNDKIDILYPCISTGQLEIFIKDVSGRVIYKETVTCESGKDVEQTVDLSSFAPGVYFIDLTLNDQHVVKKIVKL